MDTDWKPRRLKEKVTFSIWLQQATAHAVEQLPSKQQQASTAPEQQEAIGQDVHRTLAWLCKRTSNFSVFTVDNVVT